MDPDGGVNVESKHREFVNAGGSGSVDIDLAVSFPNDGWTKSLKKTVPWFSSVRHVVDSFT